MPRNRNRRPHQPPQRGLQPLPNGPGNPPSIPASDPEQDRQLVAAASQSLRDSPELPSSTVQALPKDYEVKALPDSVLADFKARIQTLDQAVAELHTRRADHKQATAELEEVRKNLEEQQTRLREQERALLDQETALELREANARNGFLGQQRAALQSLREEIARLEAERDDLVAQGEQVHRDARTAIAQDRAVFRAEQAQAQEALASERQALDAQARELQRERDRLEQARLNQDALEKQTRRDLQAEFHREIMDLKHRVYRLTATAGKDEARIQGQQKALDTWDDVQAEIERQGLDSPEGLLSQLADLRVENRSLREAKHARPIEDVEADNEALRDRSDEQERRLEDRAREIEALRMELSLHRVGVLEKQTLAQEKRVLERHKQALDSAVNDLEQRLDDLTTRQQGTEVFPALAKMDREFTRHSATEDVTTLKEFAGQLRQRIATATDTKLYYSEQVIRLFLGGLAMSQLHILQGISGTGKTSLAKAFAEAVGGHCTLVPVQAGWRDRDDLLGHFNAFERRFYERECLQAVYRAGTETFKDRINVVLLDEMNLSHPEQYFAEFLSVMEPSTREDGVALMETATTNAPTLLREGRFLQIPGNLWFIGTANQDETTKGFADKTIDRAHVMELPRNDKPFDLEKRAPGLPISLNSLRQRFSQAEHRHRNQVTTTLQAIQKSGFSKLLEKDFDLGWGNRLEHQAQRFVPVVMEAGGDLGEGFDHLLASRLFRPGKITERYDIGMDALQDLKGKLEAVWEKVDPRHPLPEQCLERLESEIKRKEQQG